MYVHDSTKYHSMSANLNILPIDQQSLLVLHGAGSFCHLLFCFYPATGQGGLIHT